VSKTTRAAVVLGPGSPLELREITLPEPGGACLLVEVLACTLCGSDLHTMHGRRPVAVPTILGHEALGRVAGFGPDAARRDAAGRPLRAGDRVTWGVVARCGACFYCRRGLPQKCERQTYPRTERPPEARGLRSAVDAPMLVAPLVIRPALHPPKTDSIAARSAEG
jgi:alcohol dehydrogenase